ncbi:MAG TPA: hypothetical protein VJ024_08530 [Thermodesulfovibrionales bacterium]|nr:hypothetical protein [Thermodesulfovibrionales bacterium]
MQIERYWKEDKNEDQDDPKHDLLNIEFISEEPIAEFAARWILYGCKYMWKNFWN